jgi:membrane-associated protease RseP (regulator of RpoE activity)
MTLGIVPEQANVILHPIAFAGWIGLFVTAMNLLPVGQLDGGHVVYALFGWRHIWVSRLALGVVLGLGLLRWWDGWLIWGVLLLFMGVHHPSPLDPDTPLDRKRQFLGWLTLLILTITFIPVPFSIDAPKPTASERLSASATASPVTGPGGYR